MNRSHFALSLLTGLLLTTSMAADYTEFKGRISKINLETSVMRVRAEFKNLKFLTNNSEIDFGVDYKGDYRCHGRVLGKSNQYLLIKVKDFKKCSASAQIQVGAEILLHCGKLGENVRMAEDVLEILMKKKIAVQSRLKREDAELKKYIGRVESINSRFEILIKKLEQEWQEELSALELDRLESLKRYNEQSDELNELEHKMEQYRVEGQEIKVDPWALDHKIYKVINE